MKGAVDWSPVETAPLSERVLVVNGSGHQLIARKEPDHIGASGWFLRDDGRLVINITHWQPLPDPPRRPISKRISCK